LKELVSRHGKDVIVTRGSTYDNRANLAPSFFSQIVRRYEGTRLGRQELNAEILEDIEGALWTRDMIEASRRPKDFFPDLKRVVVAIDPAVSSGEDSDETGIIVAGVGYDDRGYVLEDLSGRYSPTEWARKAVGAYRKHRADKIVAEKNRAARWSRARSASLIRMRLSALSTPRAGRSSAPSL
jgi:phage terminase large subunit-like protein